MTCRWCWREAVSSSIESVRDAPEGFREVLDIIDRQGEYRDVPATEPREVLTRSGARCPVCTGKIVVDGPDEVIVRNAILRVERLSGRVTAKCVRCKTWVEVSLRYVG